MSEADRYKAGCAARRRVLGDAYADRTEQAAVADAATDVKVTAHLASTFHSLASAHAWGAVWPRDGLDHRARSIATMGMLMMIGNKEELRLHFAAALRLGLYDEHELGEAILQAAVHGGHPMAEDALLCLQQVLGKRAA